MLPRVRFAVRASVILGVGSLCLWSLAGESPVAGHQPKGSLIQYSVPGGESYFALSIRAPELGSPAAHDHVLLVDTSASQTGAHRQQALDVAEAFLAAMPAGDRVRVMAVDVGVQPLSSDFFSPSAAETRAALAQLRRRVPLGATNLAPALTASLDAFVAESGTGTRGRSILYIGDGMSTGRLIGFEELGALVTRLRHEKIAIHSYAIGPRTDLQLLGVLAVHTGGVAMVDEVIDERTTSIETIGRKLAQAADAPVFYADSLNLEPAVDHLLPLAVPPLRADRDTILLGKGGIADVVQVAANGEGRKLQWTINANTSQGGNTFLAALWNTAEGSNGWGVAVAGSEFLNIARQDYEDQVGQLVAAGRQAVANRNLEQAEQFAWAVRNADPGNVEADTILNATERVKASRTQLALQPVEPRRPAANPPAPEGGTVKETDLTESFRDAMRVRTERLTKEVNQTIEAARKTAPRDPDTSLGGLKRVLNTVTSSSDIDPADRETLRRRVQNALDQIAVQKQQIELKNLQNRERLAAIQARRLAISELEQREAQLEQLIDNVRSLLHEGFAGNAEAFERAESVARAAWELEPYKGVTAAAVFDTEAAGQLDKIMRLRNARSDKFLEVLGLVEKAHIPFPDEPPIVWPAPEVWKDLTERRKKWASVDLTQHNKAEQKIINSLSKPTEVNFLETPLEEAINYLKDYHGINIWIDKPALQDEGVAIDQPITLQHTGVSFRSTLKLMLESLQLTWVIEDEVMKITTSQKAADKLTTRVYPVADLVIPIQTPQAGGIGQGLGGAGGIGGGGGGIGAGGQFGGGGMMGGGGFGGGGMFNVADEISSSDTPAAESKNATSGDRKKKRESSR